MTAYCTQSDLETRFGAEEILELTDRDADDVMDAGVLDVVIADASATIDSYIAKRYDLPLPQVPPVLTKVACDIARYNLHGDLPTDTVSDNYKQAINFLRDISSGKAVLDVQGNEPTSAPNDILVDASPRVFTHDTLKGF